MAKLSKYRGRPVPAAGHDFDRINEKLYGQGRHKVNRRKELFSSDYIFVDDDGDDDIGGPSNGESGIDKNHHRFHDADWCNMEKNEHYDMNRFIDSLPSEDSDLEDIMDILEEEEGEHYE